MRKNHVVNVTGIATSPLANSRLNDYKDTPYSRTHYFEPQIPRFLELNGPSSSVLLARKQFLVFLYSGAPSEKIFRQIL